jgi:peptidoglycan/xylan/chitin deacetylase (PgdA/CDA1 family)
MFTFRSITFIFFILLLLMNVLVFAGFSIPFFFYILLIAGYITVSVTASFFICSGFHMKALCSRETEQKVIAITFDDGPHPGNTEAVLDVLKNRAKATFFCIGSKVQGKEYMLKRMQEEGHLVGTHSYSHSNWFDLFSAKKMKRELKQSEDLIYDILGKKPLLFRPPYGVINPMLKKALGSFSYHIIGYSNRSLDTVTKDENKVIERLIRNLQPGDIVLLHDTVPYAASLLKKFLDRVSDKGFIVIGLDELLNIQAYG